MAEPLISKRGKLVVQTEKKGVRPATREDLDSASLVGARGAIFVETTEGLQPATVGDARSAVGRLARALVQRQVGGFSDPAVASRAGRKARTSEGSEVRRERGVRAGTAAAKKLSPDERKARARKGWRTRRLRQDSESK
jgi:hypothetical protein